MYSTTTTALLIMVSMWLTPTTAFVASSPRNAFGVVRNRHTQLFDTEDEANEWYSPPIKQTAPAVVRRPVKTAPRESVITSAEELQDFINPPDEDDRLTIVKYHASWYVFPLSACNERPRNPCSLILNWFLNTQVQGMCPL